MRKTYFKVKDRGLKETKNTCPLLVPGFISLYLFALLSLVPQCTEPRVRNLVWFPDNPDKRAKSLHLAERPACDRFSVIFID